MPKSPLDELAAAQAHRLNYQPPQPPPFTSPPFIEPPTFKVRIGPVDSYIAGIFFALGFLTVSFFTFVAGWLIAAVFASALLR